MSIVDRWKRLQWQGCAAADGVGCLDVCPGADSSIWIRGLPERLAPADADLCIDTGFWDDFLFETVVGSTQSVRNGIASSKFTAAIRPSNHERYCLGSGAARLRLSEFVCDVDYPGRLHADVRWMGYCHVAGRLVALGTRLRNHIVAPPDSPRLAGICDSRLCCLWLAVCQCGDADASGIRVGSTKSSTGSA